MDDIIESKKKKKKKGKKKKMKKKGKLYLTRMWFDQNLSYLSVVWNLIFYSLDISLIRIL